MNCIASNHTTRRTLARGCIALLIACLSPTNSFGQNLDLGGLLGGIIKKAMQDAGNGNQPAPGSVESQNSNTVGLAVSGGTPITRENWMTEYDKVALDCANMSQNQVACAKASTAKRYKICTDVLDSLPNEPSSQRVLQDLSRKCTSDLSTEDNSRQLFSQKLRAKGLALNSSSAQTKFDTCMSGLNAIPVAAGNANMVLKQRSGCSFESSDLATRYWDATKVKLAEIAKLDDLALGQLVSKHAPAIKALGFSDAFLKATIYLQVDMYNRPKAWMTMETWLGKLFESGNYASITRITSGKSQGVMLKRQGMQSGGILFVLDGGELFPSHSASAGNAEPIESVGEQITIATAITQSIN